MSRIGYLITRRTQSRKYHPEDIHGVCLLPTEAESEMKRLNRIDLGGDRYTIEQIKVFGVLEEHKLMTPAADAPYEAEHC